MYSHLHLSKCFKILRIFCGSRGRKILFSTANIKPFLYLAIFIRNEISYIYDNLGKYIRVFQSLEIYKVNEHAHFRENLKSRKLLTFDKNIHVSCVWNDFKMFISPHNGFSFVAYHVSWWQVTKVKFTKISQQSNMYIYISTICCFPVSKIT